ncbi:MAG: N-acetylmuramoyl-L-alanine amidase [Oscillospiraceae bacterium]
MAVKIIEDYVVISSKHRPGTKRTGFRGVTIHETGNRNAGASAKSHNTYYHNLALSNQEPEIGYHYFVDDKEAYLECPLDEIAWTNSDGNGDGNMKTIAVEICVNPESNFNIACENGAFIAANILKINGVNTVVDGLRDKTSGNLWQHFSWSKKGKNCPETIRNNGLWESFVASVQRQLDLMNNVANPPSDVIYKVQVGAFKDKSNAEKLSAELAQKGYKNFIVK